MVYWIFLSAWIHPSVLMWTCHLAETLLTGISGLVVEYIVAIDVTRVRFPADAFCASLRKPTQHLLCEFYTYRRVLLQNWHESGVATAISGLAA
jgi:hypothetical protein